MTSICMAGAAPQDADWILSPTSNRPCRCMPASAFRGAHSIGRRSSQLPRTFISASATCWRALDHSERDDAAARCTLHRQRAVSVLQGKRLKQEALSITFGGYDSRTAAMPMTGCLTCSARQQKDGSRPTNRPSPIRRLAGPLRSEPSENGWLRAALRMMRPPTSAVPRTSRRRSCAQHSVSLRTSLLGSPRSAAWASAISRCHAPRRHSHRANSSACDWLPRSGPISLA